MRFLFAGPISIRDLAPLLCTSAEVPTGLGITPLNRLVRALREQGHHCTVVTLDYDVPEKLELEGDRLRLVVGPYRREHRARDLFAAERGFVRRAIDALPEPLVNAHWSYEFALGALESAKTTVVSIHDWAPAVLRHSPHPYRVARWWMNRSVLTRARYLISNSPYIADAVRRTHGKASVVIPNAVEDDAVVRSVTIAPRDEARLVAIVNGWIRLKNVTTLLRAFPRIRAGVPGSTLTIFGSGYERGGPAERWARGRNLADGVDFRGAVGHEELSRTLSSFDMLVHPSLEESFGTVLVEAMARGVPVIGGRTSGAVPWVLGDGAGMLVDVRVPKAIADAAVALIRDRELRRRTAERGLARVRSQFRSSSVAKAYADTLAAIEAEVTIR